MAQAWRIVLGLVIGLLLSMVLRWGEFAYLDQAVAIADPVGQIWLDGLKMTIIPLVISLLVTGIARTADSARGGGLALRSVVLFISLLWISTAIAAVLVPLLLDIWPLPRAAAEALRGAISQTGIAATPTPGFAELARSIVPTNPISAAANDALLPLIVFTTLFAVAITRLPARQREPLVLVFDAVADAMLVMIGWVLWLAPIGVFALAFVVGVHAGTAAIGALAHYIAIISLTGISAWALAYPVARFGGKVPLGRFVRATLPAQAVALSTQSSLASLPSMLKSAENLGVPHAAAGVSLPIAVAIFRVTGPGMNLAVAMYVAHWLGIELTVGTIAIGAVVAAITTLGAVSLPGQVSFLTSIAPIAAAMGVPIEPLALLVAVEMIPDLIRTIGNVTMDVAATSAVSRMSGHELQAPEAMQPAS